MIFDQFPSVLLLLYDGQKTRQPPLLHAVKGSEPGTARAAQAIAADDADLMTAAKYATG